VYELPSVPVNVTCVAFVAVTVRVEDDPAVMVRGFAIRFTVVSVADTVTVAEAEAVPLAFVAIAV
jgi:hypothetical protein